MKLPTSIQLARLSFAAVCGLLFPCLAAQAAEDSTRVYFGTYTRGDVSKGIYTAVLDLKTGKVSEPELAAEVTNPSFLAIHPDGKHLYSVSEVAESDGKKTGAVTAFEIDAETGKLKELNHQSSGGAGPCHVSVDATGKVAMVANYGGGSVSSIPIKEDGSLGEPASFVQHEGGSGAVEKRQEGPHAHSINVDPGNKFAVVADLGKDQLLIYQLDPSSGSITAHGMAEVAPGGGPRHFAFHPNGKFAYTNNEMSLTVTGFAFDPEAGTLTEIQSISTVPVGIDREGISTAEIQVHKSGKFLYVSNRGHDTIAVYAIDQDTGKLTLVEREPVKVNIPRNFGIDPTGKYLLAAGQKSNNVSVFTIDQDTGELDFTGQTLDVGSPVCVRFLAAE